MPTMKAKTGTSCSIRMATARHFDRLLPPGSTARSLMQVFNQEQITHHREESWKSMLDAISVDIYTLNTTTHIHCNADSHSAVKAIVQHGYFATTPVKPSLTISFKTLELFRYLWLCKPSFSIKAYTKVICDFYAIPYQHMYWVSLSNTFNMYLSIHRVIDGRRTLNACPACCYELKDEPPLRFSHMVCIDGNNSLKRMAKVGDCSVDNTRVFSESDYFLSKEFINQYTPEMKIRKCNMEAGDDFSTGPPPEAVEDVGDDEGDPTDLAPRRPGEKSCIDNWKAATDNLKKKIWGVFEEIGIFACACRHRFILWIMDMIRSGELAKYPLAIVAKALELISGAGLLGYDIGCDFEETIKRSLLGALWHARGWRCYFETLERVFSSFNQLTSVRHISIDLFFKQWDENKYANLAAITESQAIEEALDSLGIREKDLKKWYTDEKEYFITLDEEPPWDVHAMAYVDLLQEFWKIDDASQTHQVEMERQHLAERCEQILCDLIDIEQPTTPDYMATLKYVAMRDYHHALDNLQWLVIQRLFELYNLNLSQTGYRMRTHITKSLQTWCKAIRTAVNTYNWAALALDPPRPTLDWDKVSHFNTRNDIYDKPWMCPAIHETMKKNCRVVHYYTPKVFGT
ncbi:hypothetical protein OBBRIDRAFT_815570 [Obba rivulosa]|uniref:Uncharacterized protein n=1 Tax=Obba rivulosa TaxID=1052685 RepID=A0A8E2AGU7_9APHY|nr:hypothetical protein OBBRIDRAFT_815570 [Obba rivulosa]